MARPLRIEFEGAYYHVTARGNERRKIFFTQRDFEKFKGYIATAQEKYGFSLHSYVLMSNHYHLIMETPASSLSRIIHHINSSYTTYINIKRKRSGHLFQGRYKAIVVDKDSYLLMCNRRKAATAIVHCQWLTPIKFLYQATEEVAAGLLDAHPWPTAIANSQIRNEQLVIQPFFRKPGVGQLGYPLFDSTVIGAYVESIRDELLALALPSLTLVTGGWLGEDIKTRLGKDIL